MTSDPRPSRSLTRRSTRSMSRRRRLSLASGMLAVTLTAASCTTGGSSDVGGSGSSDKTFDVAVGIDLDTLDPPQMTTTTVANLVDYSVETLTKLAKNGQTVPGLATSWNLSSDGKTLTLQLRKGVTFQDGSPFDAKAVKFNLDRLLDPKVESPQRAPYESISSVDTVGDSTVRLNLSRPDPALPAALSASSAGLISPKSINAPGNSYTNVTHPVGTGPYSFVKYQQGDTVEFKKFDDYWGAKPYYENVVFHIVPEAATRESLVLAGQAEMAVLPPVADLQELSEGDDTNTLLAPSDRTIFMAFKTPGDTFDDPTVRQAINYAVNKQAIIQNVLFGAAEPMTAPVAPSVEGYCHVGSYPFDPKKAEQMLAKAGVKKVTITVGTPTGRYLQDKEATDAIAGNLRDVGLQVNIRTMDWASYLGAVDVPASQQPFDMHLLGWAPAFLDASQQMLQFRSDQAPPNGLATSLYSNKQVDALSASASTELNPQQRQADYCQAWKTIWNDAPWLFLWVQKYPIVYSSDVTGISYLPNEKFNAVYAKPAS
jgi:peptide/nickel transport system substrate-binding protein